MPFPLESFEQMQGFFWVFLRISILVFFMPFFGAKGLPVLWKVGLSVVIAIILTPVIPPQKVFPQTGIEVVLGVFHEVIMGLILIMGIKMLFASVQLAGQLMSFQMGFSMARAVDPFSGIQSTSLSQFLYLFTVLTFFAIDGHHLLIRGMAASFYLVPPASFSINPSITSTLIELSSQMFLVALKIAAPIMVALFLTNLCLGIVARTVPQVNILMIGFPLNIGIGLILFGLVLSSISPLITSLTRGTGEVFIRLLKLM